MCILRACDLTRGVLSVRYQSGINQNLYENDYDYFVFIIWRPTWGSKSRPEELFRVYNSLLKRLRFVKDRVVNQRIHIAFARGITKVRTLSVSVRVKRGSVFQRKLNHFSRSCRG